MLNSYYLLKGGFMKKIIVFVSALAILTSFVGISKASAAAKLPFDYELVYQSPYPSTMAPGSTTNVWIEVKNTGTVTWNRNGIINVVRLGSGSKYGNANQQRDYTSEFSISQADRTVCTNNSCSTTDQDWWLSPNRPTAILHPVIEPGWNTRFQFDIKAPTTPGTYKAYFTPVVEGVEWMKDIGIYWQITVSSQINCTSDPNAVGCANPASVKCVDDGGWLETHNTTAGQYNVCHLPTGLNCEEWDYYNNGSSCTNITSNATLSSLTLSPNGAVSVKSGTVYDFVLIANYSDGSTQTVTSSAVWDVVYDTGTGTMQTTIPGRFIAGGIGTCTVTASYGGKSVISGIITVTGL